MPLESWGRYPSARQAAVPVHWRSDPLPRVHGTLLPFGQGRSYGDCCLNDGGTLLETARLDRFIEFDAAGGVLRCEAGARLGEVLAFLVPRGFFLPVVPGTQFVSVGGAIANDIHGKNHFRAGTFGRHVARLEVLRSTGERTICSPEENADLFAATVGGLGLTGLVTWAEQKLQDRKSTRLNSSHLGISYAVFCLKKKKNTYTTHIRINLMPQTATTHAATIRRTN